MYYIHPTAGEKFYLCLLLTTVKGATSWDDLYSFEGRQYPSFKEACIACGLLDDDQEWHQCLEEARYMQSERQLCHLFVTIIRDCIPSAPRALWDTFWPYICNDIRHMLQNHANIPEPSNEQIQDCGLYLIDKLLSQSGKRLQQWLDMPQVDENQGALLENVFIQAQHQYNIDEQARLAEECIANLNLDHQAAFERITSAIANRTGETFFLHSPRGTGKTYIYNMLCYQLQSQQKIVLCIALQSCSTSLELQHFF